MEKLFPEGRYGFLRTVDGREVYFHSNSVLHGDSECLERVTLNPLYLVTISSFPHERI